MFVLFLSFLSFGAGISKQMEGEIRKSGIPSKHLSLFVAAPGKAPIYQLNEDLLRIPASLTKLVTGALILKRSTSYDAEKIQVSTRLVTNAKMEKGKLSGDLYLVGGGDPGFTSEKMWELANRFHRSGIRTISGNLIVDDSLFDSVRFDPSRSKKRVDRAYDAPIGAMSFNWNAVNIFVRPGDNLGDPAIVHADPENNYVSISNKVKTGGKKTRISISKKATSKGDVFVLSGKIKKEEKEKVFYRAISEPALWSGENMKSFLMRRGIFVAGEVKKGRAPKNFVLLAELEGKPLADMIRDMQKYSNNFVAEMLVKLSSAWEDSPGTMEKGVEVLNDELKKWGWKKEEFRFLNPSGLSRENKLTAFQVYQVLKKTSEDFKSGPEFIASLPISGIDGTLKKRFVAEETKRLIRAKTGYLSGVVGLAGYARPPSGENRIFAFVYNGSPRSDYKAKALFDRLAAVLTKEEGVE